MERAIASLEARLAQVEQDAVSKARRLAEVEKRILECYMEIDAAEAEIEEARSVLTRQLRSLYMTGRQDPVISLINSRSITDFLMWYECVVRAISMESRDFDYLREKRANLQRVQEELQAFKKEQARLSETPDTAAMEAQIALLRDELALISASLIAMQLPTTHTPEPLKFNPGRVYSRPDENAFNRTGQIFSGYSSWYGASSHGKSTASGETFDQFGFTCAHGTLPFGTHLRVTFLGRSVIVKVNDRGPSVKGRILDLSRGAAEAIGLTGVQWVDCEIVVPRS